MSVLEDIESNIAIALHMIDGLECVLDALILSRIYFGDDPETVSKQIIISNNLLSFQKELELLNLLRLCHTPAIFYKNDEF